LRITGAAFDFEDARRGSYYVAPQRDLEWPAAKRMIDKAIAERAFVEALAIFERLRSDDATAAEVCARRAACHLDAGEPGLATDYARRALTRDPATIDARLILVRALLDSHAYGDALAEAKRLLAAYPYDAHVHYLHGRALIRIGRLEDARDAFDLAIALKPTLLEAFLLRRQVDDNLRKLGKSVGAQRTSIALAESLEHLREILASGRSKQIIEALSALPDDLDAQLLLARYLGFEGKHDDALGVYEKLIATRIGYAAMVGKATTLFELGQYDAALAYFDALVAERSGDTDACEGRARTLEKLGRLGEAAAEFRRLVSLTNAESNLRVRAAKLWLDAHPL
jgi:tetratricopeptide (TPR) repeat protein